MTTTNTGSPPDLDLASGPVLERSADTILETGLAKDEFVDDEGGRCSAGAIGEACGLDPADWYEDDPPVDPDGGAYQQWLDRRAAALAALRTLVDHIDPASRPEEMTADALIERVATWNDHPDRTAGQVAAAMRAAAAEAVTSS